MFKKIFLATVITAGVFGGIYLYNKSSNKEATSQAINKEPKIEKPATVIESPKTETKEESPAPTTTSNATKEEQNEKILSIIKIIASAQSNWSQENGCYVKSISKLETQDSQLLKDVIKSFNTKKAFSGYIFTEILDDKDTDDNRVHFGLLAIPVNSNSGKSYLLLMDSNLQQAFGEKKSVNLDSDEIQLYESSETKPTLNTWPKTADLSNWTRIKSDSSKNVPGKKAP